MSRRARSDQQKRQTPVTLEDVARVAGVTSMTVSRVVKGRGYVSSATREKVLRAVEELNYTANPAARTLATGRTGIIAIICPQLSDIYAANIVHLLEEQLTASGYQMRLLHSKSELKDVVNATKSSAVDGVIVNGMHDLSDEPEFLDSQLARRCVFLDTFEHPNTDYVRIDMREAVEQALERMIAIGRERIAYVGLSNNVQFDPSSAVEDRLRTYLTVMKRHERTAEFINSRQRPGMNRTERIHAVREYLQAHGCPDGLICLYDEMAIITYRALRDCGLRIPEDTLLVGCEGVASLECFDPPLSAIAQPLEEACALAWQFLQTRIEHADTPLQQANLKAQFEGRGPLQREMSRLSSRNGH